MLGNETGGSHTRCGVHFEHGYLTLLRDDIVDADDAIAMKDIIDMAGNLRHAVCYLWRDTSRRDLLHLTIILGVVVEELIAGHNLRDWEDNSLLTGLVDTLCDLRPFKETLDHHLRALQYRLADGWGQLIFILHLRDAKRRTICSRFHEAGHADALLDLIIADQFLIALTDQQGVGHADTITTQILVKYELIESHCLYQHAAGAIWHVNQIKVALQQPVLTWSTMDSDIGIIEQLGLSVLYKGEIVAVNLGCRTVMQFNMPILSLDVNDIDIITLLVEEGVKSLSRAQRHIVLG